MAVALWNDVVGWLSALLTVGHFDIPKKWVVVGNFNENLTDLQMAFSLIFLRIKSIFIKRVVLDKFEEFLGKNVAHF